MTDHTIKRNRVRKISKTARYPRTFDARANDIPEPFWDSLTAAQIAAIIDGPMHLSYMAGVNTGYSEVQT